MLHIHNGDSTANTMREASFPGDHLAFREALALGPAPQTATAGEWLDARASYLARASDGERDKIRADLVQMDQALNRVADYAEGTLWVEPHLVCQINLSYRLPRFRRAGTGGARLSLI